MTEGGCTFDREFPAFAGMTQGVLRLIAGMTEEGTVDSGVCRREALPGTISKLAYEVRRHPGVGRGPEAIRFGNVDQLI